MKAVSASEDPRFTLGNERIPICNITRFKYGLLPHRVDLRLVFPVYDSTTMGKYEYVKLPM
eukprot:7844523-Ditylum_brightwellii.AAC.1